MLLALLAALAFAGCGSDNADKLGTVGGSGREGSESKDRSGTRAGPGDGAGSPAGGAGESASPNGEGGGASGLSKLPADPRPPVERTEVVRRADRICRAAHRELLELSEALSEVVEDFAGERISERDYKRRSVSLLRDTRTVIERAFTDMVALRPPKQRKRDYGRYLGAIFQQSRLLAAQERAVAKGDKRLVTRLNRARVGAARRGHGFARRFGLRVCGGGI